MNLGPPRPDAKRRISVELFRPDAKRRISVELFRRISVEIFR